MHAISEELACSKGFIPATIWPWVSLEILKGHIKVNVKFLWDYDMENIPVMLQYDAGNN